MPSETNTSAVVHAHTENKSSTLFSCDMLCIAEEVWWSPSSAQPVETYWRP